MATHDSQLGGELQSDLYERAIDAARATIADPGKRKSPRLLADLPLKLVPVDGGLPVDTAIAVQLTDVSRGGLGVTAARPLPQDSRHLVTLQRDGLPPMWLECTVRHCEKLDSEQYSVGAEFVAMHGQLQLSVWGVDLEQFADAA
ncbi:hypothetical protein BH09PLA1_BH09PLA1_24440 [soil metagenome]